MNKTNLLFLGTTNYGFELSKSDENKFRELNEKFNFKKIGQNRKFV